MTDDITTPERLLLWMRRRGMTQPELAAQLRCVQSKISRIIKGKTKPSVDDATIIERLSDGEIKVSDWASEPVDKAPDSSEESDAA